MKLTFGQIKFFAHQFVKGIPIPLFTDRKTNRDINKFIDKIYKAQTKRKRTIPDRRKAYYEEKQRNVDFRG
jgi:hypothetical protein